jgi:hypothetical protein
VSVRSGSATIELIVACALAGVAAVSVAAGTTLAARLVSMADNRAGAVLASAHAIDSLTSVHQPASGAARSGRYDLDWTVRDMMGGQRALTLRTRWVVAGHADSLILHASTAPAPPRVGHVQ